MHACVFCPERFRTLKKLVYHLLLNHNGEVVRLATGDREWKVYRYLHEKRVLCFCGERFTVSLFCAPAFLDWAVGNGMEMNSYVAHLVREGGLAAHLKEVKNDAVLEKIERAVTIG